MPLWRKSVAILGSKRWAVARHIVWNGILFFGGGVAHTRLNLPTARKCVWFVSICGTSNWNRWECLAVGDWAPDVDVPPEMYPARLRNKKPVESTNSDLLLTSYSQAHNYCSSTTIIQPAAFQQSHQGEALKSWKQQLSTLQPLASTL